MVVSEPIEFMLYGDSAPNARFNYRYEVVQQQAEVAVDDRKNISLWRNAFLCGS